MALTQTQVSQLYVSIFNRASEGEGNKYWQQSADAKAAANNMLATPAAQAYFGTSLDSNEAFIKHIYLNTLNKTYAQDKAGVDYWVSLLNAGTSRGEVVASLVAAVADYSSSTDPVTKAAYDQFNNRVDVSNYMANTVEKAPANYATSTKFATTGTTGLVVTNSASTVTAAKTSVDTMKPVPGQTFTLTTGVDNIFGTAGNDTVTGTLGTLNDGDRVTDNSTTDSDIFNGELMGNLTHTFHVKNIETVNLDILAGTSIIDATYWTGIKTISNKGAGNLTLSNVSSLDTAIKLDGTASNANIGFLASVVSGSSDLATVKLAKTTNGTLTMDNGVETLKLVTTAGEANTLNNLVTGAVGSKTVQITGGGEIKIAGTATAIAATTTTVDARDTAKATLNHTNAANVAILTGAGNDTVQLNTVLLTSNLISMGAGEDTLVLNGVANLAGVLRGVENITLKTAASTIDMTNADQKAALTFEGGTTVAATELAAGSTVTSTKLAASTVNVAFRDSVMGEKTTIDLQKGASTSVTVKNIKDATINYGDTSTGLINLDASNANGSEVTTDLTVNAKGGALSALALTPANAGELKNLTLNATAGTIAAAAAITGLSKLDTLVVNATKGVTLAGITSANTAAMTKIELNATGGDITTGTITNGGSIKDVVITGTKDVAANFISTAANVDKLVSTTTGATTINITNITTGTANEAGSTVTLGNAADGKANSLTFLGAGNQNNTVTGGTGNDTIVTVGGNDTINAGAGNDTITGGAGNDTIILTETTAAIDKVVFTGGATTAAVKAAQGIDTITGFGSTDTLNIAALGDGTTTATGLTTVTTAAAQGALTDDTVAIITTTGAAANLTTGGTATLAAADLTAATLTNLAAFLSERYTTTNDDAQENVFVINFGTKAYVYHLDTIATQTTAIEANEIALVGTVDANLTSANLVYA